MTEQKQLKELLKLQHTLSHVTGARNILDVIETNGTQSANEYIANLDYCAKQLAIGMIPEQGLPVVAQELWTINPKVGLVIQAYFQDKAYDTKLTEFFAGYLDRAQLSELQPNQMLLFYVVDDVDHLNKLVIVPFYFAPSAVKIYEGKDRLELGIILGEETVKMDINKLGMWKDGLTFESGEKILTTIGVWQMCRCDDAHIDMLMMALDKYGIDDIPFYMQQRYGPYHQDLRVNAGRLQERIEAIEEAINIRKVALNGPEHKSHCVALRGMVTYCAQRGFDKADTCVGGVGELCQRAKTFLKKPTKTTKQ